MRKIFNPLYKLLSRTSVLATTKEELQRTWEDDYKPFGWMLVQKPKIKHLVMYDNAMYEMKVCKTLTKITID